MKPAGAEPNATEGPKAPETARVLDAAERNGFLLILATTNLWDLEGWAACHGLDDRLKVSAGDRARIW